MQWKNLNQNRCPKCGAELKKASTGRGKECGRCSFFVSQKRLLEIMDNFDRDDRKKEMEGYGF